MDKMLGIYVGIQTCIIIVRCCFDEDKVELCSPALSKANQNYSTPYQVKEV